MQVIQDVKIRGARSKQNNSDELIHKTGTDEWLSKGKYYEHETAGFVTKLMKERKINHLIQSNHRESNKDWLTIVSEGNFRDRKK